MASFKGITIADTRDCLLAALRAVAEPEAAQVFEHNFKSLERLWEALSPDPCPYEYRFVYGWLCGIYFAYRRRKKGASLRGTFGELSNKTLKVTLGKLEIVVPEGRQRARYFAVMRTLKNHRLLDFTPPGARTV
jgi:hypothetical protein